MADETLANLLKEFKEFFVTYKVINRKTIVELLKTELKNEQLIQIYQQSDGKKSSRELAGVLKNKCSHATVVNNWNRWASLGIVIPAKQKGRFMAAFDLQEYGITKIEQGEEI